MRTVACLTTLFLAASSTLLLACPDPGEELDLFVERYDKLNPGSSSSTGPSVCMTPLLEGEADGDYLFALSARLDAPKAFALKSTLVATTEMDGTMLVDLTLQPLSAMDQTTEVCTPHVLTDLLVNADGSFTWDISAQTGGTLSLCGEANPISGAEIVTTLTLTGTMCGGVDLGFICGVATGSVTVPFPLELTTDTKQSTFTLQKYMGALPAPVINCAKDPAMY